MPKIIEAGKIEVEANDSLGSIAHHFTGDSRRYTELLRCNPGKTNAAAGSVLNLPEGWGEPGPSSGNTGADAPPPLVIAPDLSAIVEWIEKADEIIGRQGDEIEILKAQRAADQERLAAQGGEISAMKAKLAEWDAHANEILVRMNRTAEAPTEPPADERI